MTRFFAFGSGVGIQITADSLEIAAARVRPNGARLLDRLTIPNFAQTPAQQWGAEYAAFLRKLDLRHVPAAVLLPRHDVIVRQIALAGVSKKDLDAAVEFQLEGLHPYADSDVVASWARLGATSTVLIAIARRAAIDRYAALFAEAGIRLATFTCSAAAIYSALRILPQRPAAELLAFEALDGQVEYYGESAARPLFSATFPETESRAASLAASELRLDAVEPKPLGEIFSAAPALPYAAALTSACPRGSLSLNLLPSEQRQTSSRANWVPLAVAGTMAVVSAAALIAVPMIENRRYQSSLQVEIRNVEKRANRAAQLDRETADVRARTALLDDFHRQTKSDLDILGEMTRVLPTTVWLNSFDLTRNQVTVSGVADQAAPLLKTIDASPWFEASEFVGAPIHVQGGENFRIRSSREGGK